MPGLGMVERLAGEETPPGTSCESGKDAKLKYSIHIVIIHKLNDLSRGILGFKCFEEAPCGSEMLHDESSQW